MIIRIKKKTARFAGVSLFSVLFLFVLLVGVTVESTDVSAGNTSNVSVLAIVNVSNGFPYLYDVNFAGPVDSTGNIDIEAGNVTTVICNGSFSDPNGFDDVTNVNATIFKSDHSTSSADENWKYINESCGATCSVVAGTGNLNGSCTCQFAVQYYAEPGDWACNMTLIDNGSLSSNNQSALTNLNNIIGISVDSSVLDYGNMSVTEISDPAIEHAVTNIGNTDMNLTFSGYGGDNASIGQNVTMICNPTFSQANISFGNQRYDHLNTTPFETMHNLTNSTRTLPDFYVPKRFDTVALGNSTNSTFWRLRIPVGVSGDCNGTIIFGARDATVT